MAAPINDSRVNDSRGLELVIKSVKKQLTGLQEVVQQLCCPSQDSPQKMEERAEKAVGTQSNLEAPEL